MEIEVGLHGPIITNNPAVLELLQKYKVAVKKLRGKNEFDIFSNFAKDVPQQNVKFYLDSIFSGDLLKGKDNNHSKQIRKDANNDFSSKEYMISELKYTESLSYATHNGEEYAMALANRSAAFFELEYYEDCIRDIDLCLRAAYPDNFKPKVYIRKAKCHQKLGNAPEMRKALTDALNLLDGLSPNSGSEQERYRTRIKDLIEMKSDEQPSTSVLYNEVPNIEHNETFLGASNAVAIKCKESRGRGYYAAAKKNIARGEVLFVEKAYAFAPCPTVLADLADVWTTCKPIIKKMRNWKNCHFCLADIKSCIPCKSCVERFYCNESCHDAAWEQFHQWECKGVQANFFRFNNYAYLALHIVFKAASSGHLEVPSPNVSETSSFGDGENNYPYVFGLPVDFAAFKKDVLMEYTAIAALTVQYLQNKTDFLQQVKKLEFFREKSSAEVKNIIGGLLLRHSVQLHSSAAAVRHIGGPPPAFFTCVFAVAMCPSVAVLTRSCTPNTSSYFIGDTMVVKATREISAGDEISCSHALLKDNILDIYFRIFDITERCGLIKKFCPVMCKCKLCTDPDNNQQLQNAYLCKNCGGPMVGGHYVPTSPTMFVCLNCTTNCLISGHQVAIDNKIIRQISVFDATQDIRLAQECLKLCKSSYVSSHPMFGALYGHMLKYYCNREETNHIMSTVGELIKICKVKRVDYHVKLLVDMYTICYINVIHMKNSSLVKTSSTRDTMNMMQNVIMEAKEIMSFYYPPFIVHMQKLEDKMLELQQKLKM